MKEREMTVKVGDKVRITGNRASSCNNVGDVGVVAEVGDIDCRIDVDGGGHSGNWSYLNEVELIKDTTITSQIRAKMEEHMSNGEYVRAVKWAQLAEQAEELEND
jgi:hypothetical protein